jgi:hypothetical protein
MFGLGSDFDRVKKPGFSKKPGFCRFDRCGATELSKLEPCSRICDRLVTIPARDAVLPEFRFVS